MSDTVYPRSPRETMCGWAHLPRYVDKIRLFLAGRLHVDYLNNFGKGFDAAWLRASGLTHDEFIAVVKGTVTDGEVADWVLRTVKKTEAEKEAHREGMFNYPKKDDVAMQERLRTRKEQTGMAHRDDIRSFVDFIDADEKRLD